jgi:two-component system sensor histidine kinase BaeS
MRLSIHHKLFLSLLLATTLVVAVMFGFMRWSFQHGFVTFLESRQQARVERLVGRLAELYVNEGGLDGLRQDRTRWWRLVAESRGVPFGAMPELGMGPGMGTGMGSGMGSGMGPGHGHGHGAGRFLDLGLALLGPDKTVIQGRVVDPARARLTPVVVEGATIAYIAQPPGEALSELVDVRFAEEQRRSFIWIALLVGALAVALSWPLANTLVRPLRRVTDAARDLAAGRYGTRVTVRSSDELGDLARDFNGLAQTLERTESARRQWMADISHELRTPLAVLRAELDAMQDGVRPLDANGVSSLQADVDRLNRLVEDLYQLSMTDLGAMSYQKRLVDPVALLEDDIESLTGEFERHGLKIDLRVDLTRAVNLHADPDRLSQLFRNLMQNSLRYSDAGGRLEIRAGQSVDHLMLDFDDTPPAVPETALEQLFERFYRVESSRSRAHGGAGLGLAICRNIVEAHGGRIAARLSPLGGLGIHIELPLTP